MSTPGWKLVHQITLSKSLRPQSCKQVCYMRFPPCLDPGQRKGPPAYKQFYRRVINWVSYGDGKPHKLCREQREKHLRSPPTFPREVFQHGFAISGGSSSHLSGLVAAPVTNQRGPRAWKAPALVAQSVGSLCAWQQDPNGIK